MADYYWRDERGKYYAVTDVPNKYAWFDTEQEAREWVAQFQIKGVQMSDKQSVATAARGDMAAFIAAARAMRTRCEDLEARGLLAGGDDPLTDTDLAPVGLTAAQFNAGVAAFAAISPTPTPQQTAAMARLAAAK
jgi:hypothetical protein